VALLLTMAASAGHVCDTHTQGRFLACLFFWFVCLIAWGEAYMYISIEQFELGASARVPKETSDYCIDVIITF
jgi:hypothetical protein